VTNLEGSVILITGATGGIGSAIAELLSEAGAIVIRSSRGAGAVISDFTNAPDVASLVPAATAVHGRLDGIVIATGVVAFGPASAVTDEVLTELTTVNASAPIRIVRDAHDVLAESARAGHEPFVLPLSGVVSETPTSGLAAYSASKSALASFMTAASREYRRDGIRLIDARPSHTETGLAGHPIAGIAPAFPRGLDPKAVAAAIVAAIADGTKDLPSSAF
jgi:NAD(P)-dependent dehydrogenase (short-subunit alcohol dehydrogenase family)